MCFQSNSSGKSDSSDGKKREAGIFLSRQDQLKAELMKRKSQSNLHDTKTDSVDSLYKQLNLKYDEVSISKCIGKLRVSKWSYAGNILF